MRPGGRISGTLCLNAPFAGVCESSYFYEMTHVIIKCRVKFDKKCSTIVLNDILFVCDLYFRHRKSFRISGRIMGTLPYSLCSSHGWGIPARAHVRTCRPRFCISGTAWPIKVNFVVWLNR